MVGGVLLQPPCYAILYNTIGQHASLWDITMAVLDIRGTHGSGKSWVVHQLLATYPHTDIMGGNGRTLGYHLGGVDAAVVGRYNRVCGGCDGIATADEVVGRVRMFAGRYRHVVLEGILVAHTFRRYSALAKDLKGYGYKFLFLDTPLQTCIARVRTRRRARGNTKPLDPKNVINDWHGVWGRVQEQCHACGHDVVLLDHRDPLPAVVALLTRGM